MVMNNMISAAGDFLELVWMELLMCGIAVLAYVAFVGKNKLTLPPAQQPKGKKNFDSDDDQLSHELDIVGRDLQQKISVNDHRGVFKIWQRLKSIEGAPHGCLPSIVRSMQQLGKPASEILAELKSAVECNPAIQDGFVELLESLQRDNGKADEALVAGVSSLLEESKQGSAGPGANDANRKRVALLTSAMRQSNSDDMLVQLDKLSAESGCTDLPAQVMSKLLAFIAKDANYTEILPKVLAKGVQFSTKALDDTLREAARRKDAVLMKHLYTIAGVADIAKGPQTYELLLRGYSADTVMVHSLFEEIMSLPSIPESLAVTVLSVCGATQDMKLLNSVLKHVQSGDDALFPTSSAVLSSMVRACVACELYNEACDLYEEKIASQDAKPDTQLNGVLMKAATEAKRDALAQQLLEQGAGDVNQHVTMIKACGRKHDLRGAKQAFDRLKQSGAPLSPLIYNCLLDACVQCGDMKGAEEYFGQMKQLSCADVVSYNTLLKSYLHQNRSEDAQRLLQEMSDRGLPANRVTYNELLNAKVAAKDRLACGSLLRVCKLQMLHPTLSPAPFC
jgi:pentatricopeptide repeat protein